MLAFTAETGAKDSGIYYCDADGSKATIRVDRPAFDGYPTWSPDGKKLAFSSDYGASGRAYICIVDIQSPDEPIKGPGVFTSAKEL